MSFDALGRLALGQVPTSAVINASLTGVSATATAGIISGAVAVTVAGVAVTASAGSLKAQIGATVSGVVVTASAGAITPRVDKTLPSVSAAASAGNITPAPSVTVAGVAATASAGNILPNPSKTLTGVSASAQVGNILPVVQAILSGVSATAQAGTVRGTTTLTLAGVQCLVSAGIVTVDVTKGGTSIWYGPSARPAARIARRRRTPEPPTLPARPDFGGTIERPLPLPPSYVREPPPRLAPVIRPSDAMAQFMPSHPLAVGQRIAQADEDSEIQEIIALLSALDFV